MRWREIQDGLLRCQKKQKMYLQGRRARRPLLGRQRPLVADGALLIVSSVISTENPFSVRGEINVALALSRRNPAIRGKRFEAVTRAYEGGLRAHAPVFRHTFVELKGVGSEVLSS